MKPPLAMMITIKEVPFIFLILSLINKCNIILFLKLFCYNIFGELAIHVGKLLINSFSFICFQV